MRIGKHIRRLKGEKGQVFAEFAITLPIFLFIFLLAIDASYVILQKSMFRYAVSSGEWKLIDTLSPYENPEQINFFDYVASNQFGKAWSTNSIRDAIAKANSELKTDEKTMEITDVDIHSVGFERAYKSIYMDEGKTAYEMAANVAPQATVTVSEDNDRRSNLTDGDYTSKWGPQVEDTSSSEIVADFGSKRHLEQISLFWENKGGYKLEGSDDNANWTEISTKETTFATGTDGKTQSESTTIVFEATYRYYRIKLFDNDDSGKWSVKLYELEMYESDGYNIARTNYRWRVVTASATITYKITPLTFAGKMIFGDTYICEERFYVERLMSGTTTNAS